MTLTAREHLADDLSRVLALLDGLPAEAVRFVNVSLHCQAPGDIEAVARITGGELTKADSFLHVSEANPLTRRVRVTGIARMEVED